MSEWTTIQNQNADRTGKTWNMKTFHCITNPKQFTIIRHDTPPASHLMVCGYVTRNKKRETEQVTGMEQETELDSFGG